VVLILGGDPAAGSPTATLLRLSPSYRPKVRTHLEDGASLLTHSNDLTGGVYKEQGRIHRGIVTRDYWGFRLHEGELQPSIRTERRFWD